MTKRSAWIAAAAFVLGVLAAGYVFVFLPEKKTEARSFLSGDARSLGTNLFAETPPIRPDLDFVAVSEKIGPTVVRIDAERVEPGMTGRVTPFDDFWDRFFGSPGQRPRSQTPQESRAIVQGTGFFISPDGYILTNNHIVEKAKKISVFTVAGDEYEANIIGTDVLTDLALIKVEGKDLPFAELGDSTALKVGEWVLAVGNPLGMEHTVTAGIVSAKGRQLGLGDSRTYEDFIQTDAAINRGNSGGPLVNLKGLVVGINSNILTPSGGNIGIGFAIPASMAKKVVIQLKDKGRVVRGRLGVSIAIRPIDQDTQKALNLKDRKGAVINDVEDGTPAEKAGLKRYDVIIGVNGQPIENSNDLRFKISEIPPGSPVEIRFIRDGKEMTVTTKVIELAPEEKSRPAAGAAPKNIGLSVEALTPPLARRYGLKTDRGLLVTDVAPGGPADRRGLAPGDIIIEANRKKIETLDQWNAMIKPLKPGDPLMLAVRREDDSGQFSEFIVTLRITD
ncbi:MAG TPA: Do family serine endopeptidase [Candidatus Aminicenantes bacterium]|nr:Do family serine endopeptidase [Candidatus Aminicenantes bacterium]